jgi:hypothetical protein
VTVRALSVMPTPRGLPWAQVRVRGHHFSEFRLWYRVKARAGCLGSPGPLLWSVGEPHPIEAADSPATARLQRRARTRLHVTLLDFRPGRRRGFPTWSAPRGVPGAAASSGTPLPVALSGLGCFLNPASPLAMTARTALDHPGGRGGDGLLNRGDADANAVGATARASGHPAARRLAVAARFHAGSRGRLLPGTLQLGRLEL